MTNPTPPDNDENLAHDLPESETPAAPGKGRQRWATALVILGSVLVLVAILSVWVKAEMLDTDQWVKTSSTVLADPAVQVAVAAYVGDEISSAPRVTAALAGVLPPRLAPIAGAATGFLGEAAQKATLRALQAGKFQKLWQEANRLAHEQLLRVIEGKTLRANPVVLNLRPLLGRVATRVGLAPDTVEGLRSNGGLIRVLSVEQVEKIQTAAKLLRGIAVAASILGLGFLILGVAIATERRKTLVLSGAALIVVGMLVLVLRRIGGEALISAVTTDGQTEAAAQATWLISTTFLGHIARGVVVLGILTLFGAWLNGPGKWATKLREFLAPALLNYRWGAYVVVSLIVLLITLNGLLPWSAYPISWIVYLILGIVFVEILRHEVKPSIAA